MLNRVCGAVHLGTDLNAMCAVDQHVAREHAKKHDNEGIHTHSLTLSDQSIEGWALLN
jgi:hypothetical protein